MRTIEAKIELDQDDILELRHLADRMAQAIFEERRKFKSDAPIGVMERANRKAIEAIRKVLSQFP